MMSAGVHVHVLVPVPVPALVLMVVLTAKIWTNRNTAMHAHKKKVCWPVDNNNNSSQVSTVFAQLG